MSVVWVIVAALLLIAGDIYTDLAGVLLGGVIVAWQLRRSHETTAI